MTIESATASPSKKRDATSSPPSRQRWFGLAALAIAALLPFRLGPATVFNLSQVLVFSCAVVGMVLLTGFTRQISLGQNFFFAVGGYAAAFAVIDLDISYLVVPFLSFALCYACGYLFGLPILGIRGTYLALVTMGMGLVTPFLVRRFEGFTGGSMGRQIEPVEPPSGLDLAADQWIYFVCLGFLVVVVTVARRIELSQVGRAMKSVGDNEIAASLSGIDVRMAKSTAFAWSGGMAGVAGALFVILVGFIAPGSLDLFLAIHLLTALVIGGQRSIVGAVLGAAFIVFVPLQTQQVSESLSGSLFGVFIIAAMLLLPDGIAGGLASLRRRVATSILRKTRKH